MSLRIDTAEWIPGALVIGGTGLGVLAEHIPSDGDDGGSYLYNDLSLPADAGKEICGRITTWPSAGTLFAYENGAFEFSGAPDGDYTFTYQLYVDGVASGAGTVSLQVGLAGGTVSIHAVADDAVFSGGAFSIPPSGAVIHASTDDSVFSGSVRVSPRFTVSVTTDDAIFSGSASVSGIVWPAESDVRLGVAYGPTGTEYTGMMTGGSGPTAEQIAAASAAAVLAALQSTTIPVNVTHFNGNLTQGSGRLGDPVRPA